MDNSQSTSKTLHDERDRYLDSGKSFIDDEAIERLLKAHSGPETAHVRDIIAKSLSLARLDPAETAALLHVTDDALWGEMFAAAAEVKNRVYGPRIVTFAPLYCSNLCVNSCLYCGFRREDKEMVRRVLSEEEIRRETEALVANGHKRLVLAFGEHPSTGVDYMARAVRTVYDVKVDKGEIRRANLNAAPQTIAGMKTLGEVGIGTYQVFQETYHHDTYARVHPRGPKSDYNWRLYALHRAQEAGVDDVAIGALFGLYDWRFEVLGLLYHAIDLEKRFNGVGPHTISFPRLQPAASAPLTNEDNPYRVNDDDFKKLITVIRLSVPYTGMIVTAREPAHIRRAAMNLGCTQTDASSRIGLASYSDQAYEQQENRQQFHLGDTRGLDEVTREFAEMGFLTSFCTAGYRCGRTGECFMNMAKSGKVHEFCIPNAIFTMKEYLIDYASAETQASGDNLIMQKVDGLPDKMREKVRAKLKDIEKGQRDIRF